MNPDLLKSLLEKLSLVDLKEEPEEGDTDLIAGQVRAEMVHLYQRALATDDRRSKVYKHQGFQIEFMEEHLEIVFQTGEKYAFAFQVDSEIVQVTRLDTLRVCTPEESKAVDDALGLVLMPQYRIQKTDYEVLAEQAKAIGITVPALIRQIVVQEAAAIREGKAQFEVNLAGNV